MMPEPEQDPYWEMAGVGIKHAQKDGAFYGLNINLFTFDLDDSESFSTVAEQVIQANPDAACMSPVFYEESLVILDNFYKTKTPCVLFNTRMAKSINEYTPFCFIDPNLYRSGRVAAELMNLVLPHAKKLAVMHAHENIECLMHMKERERGFKDYYTEKQSEVDISSHSFLIKDKSFESKISHIITQTMLDGIFVSTSSTTSITAQAIKKHNKRHIQLVGFDLLKQNIHFLKTNIINFLINQNPQFQVYQGLRYLMNNLLFDKKIPSIHQLPIEIVTKENCESFLNEAGNHFA
jgi:LacI family transcriptional regulator